MPQALLLAMVLAASAGTALGQGGPVTAGADPATRCSDLIAFWLKHGGSKGEGAGGADIVRKNAEIDCAAGRHARGILAMEDLLRRNGYSVPR